MRCGIRVDRLVGIQAKALMSKMGLEISNNLNGIHLMSVSAHDYVNQEQVTT